ncbi:hypothetical protein P5X00_36480 [Paraburkholderia sp. A2RO-4L]|uniref:hypothetical protein n=1 Tax=Paraburkholderia sp. A2RO-4L TaxID=3028374 RepID=UPI0032FDDF3B|nr:hypothetical protein [Burkholderia vietnamiensis]
MKRRMLVSELIAAAREVEVDDECLDVLRSVVTAAERRFEEQAAQRAATEQLLARPYEL